MRDPSRTDEGSIIGGLGRMEASGLWGSHSGQPREKKKEIRGHTQCASIYIPTFSLVPASRRTNEAAHQDILLLVCNIYGCLTCRCHCT